MSKCFKCQLFGVLNIKCIPCIGVSYNLGGLSIIEFVYCVSMSGSEIMPEYQVWVPWEEVEDLCLISDLIKGIVRCTKEPTDELEVALCIPYPKNAPFSVDLFRAAIRLLRKALVSNPSYQKHMSQMADFHGSGFLHILVRTLCLSLLSAASQPMTSVLPSYPT